MSGTYLISSAYAKSGVAVFYSHLDTVRILERSLRRTGLPVCFTQGCNPHIRLSTFWALPLGVATDREWFSFSLTEDSAPAEICARLNDQLPQGFAIVEVKKGRSESGIAPCYDMAVHHTCSAELARDAAERFMQRTIIEISGERKGFAFTTDIRPFLDSYTLAEGYILFHLKAVNGKNPRANQIANALNSISLCEGFEVDYIRLARYDIPLPEGAEIASTGGYLRDGSEHVT